MKLQLHYNILKSRTQRATINALKFIPMIAQHLTLPMLIRHLNMCRLKTRMVRASVFHKSLGETSITNETPRRKTKKTDHCYRW